MLVYLFPIHVRPHIVSYRLWVELIDGESPVVQYAQRTAMSLSVTADNRTLCWVFCYSGSDEMRKALAVLQAAGRWAHRAGTDV